jgi:hypothetical protein
MENIHASLRPRNNMAMIALWGFILAVGVALTRPVPILPLCVGIIAGILVGKFQAQSIYDTPIAFASARTALEVRNCLNATIPGKRAIIIQWVTAGILIIITLIQGGYYFGTFIIGYVSMMFVREIITLPALRRLAESHEV